MTRYAARTKVTAEKSRAEIETTLRRYGADQFMSGWQEGSATLGFRVKERQVRFVLHLPKEQQAVRQCWRALLLVIKAKLEAVDAGISCFEDEFLAHIMLPNGQQVGQWLRPQLALTYEQGNMPALLPAPKA